MATVYSDQVTNYEQTEPRTLARTDELGGKARILFFTYTQSGSGAAGDVIQLGRLPAGSVRLLLPLSRVYTSGQATATCDLGHEAYTGVDGTAVAADYADLDVDVDIGSAGAFTPDGTIGTHETKRFESSDGVMITAQINDAGLADADTVSGYFLYVLD